MKLIVKVSDDIEIYSDIKSYIVKVTMEGNRQPECWYFGSLTACFRNIFDHLCKERLTTGNEKDMKEVAKICLDTKKEILKIMSPFEDLSKEEGEFWMETIKNTKQ
jgi:hypothetical protein